jgi:hypothetical protein
MSDGKTRRLVGGGTGAIDAGFRAKEQKNLDWWAEVAGGAVGGYLGGVLPDIVEVRFLHGIQTWLTVVRREAQLWR